MMFLDTSGNREMLNLREPCLERTHLCDGICSRALISGGVQAVDRVRKAANALNARLIAFQQINHHQAIMFRSGAGACLQRSH